MKLALHSLRPPAAACITHYARQGHEGVALLLGLRRELLRVFDGGKAKPGRSDGRRPPQARAPLAAAVVATPPLLCSRTRPRLRHE